MPVTRKGENRGVEADPHRIGETGLTFIAISPFYADDGTITGIIDASPERPLRVTITSDNKLTISPP